jgi:hypothetical protein
MVRRPIRMQDLEDLHVDVWGWTAPLPCMPAYSISLVLHPQAVLPCPRDGEGVWAAQTPPPAPLLMYCKERAFVADASCPS